MIEKPNMSALSIQTRRDLARVAYEAQMRAYDEEEKQLQEEDKKPSDYVEDLVGLLDDVKHLIPDQKYMDMIEILSKLYSA